MKKILLATLAVASLSFSSKAQDLSFIVQGGYQGAKLTTFDAQELASGFRVGVALDWRFLNLGIAELSLQPGANFSQKGAKLVGTIRNGESVFTLSQNPTPENAINAALKMNYLDIPVLLNARVAVPIVGNVFLQAGPYVAFGIGSSTSLSTGDKAVDNSVAEVTKNLEKSGNFDLFKDIIMDKFDWGLQFGGGLEFSRVMLTIGYQLGLKDLSKTAKSPQEVKDIIEEGIRKSLKSGTKNSSFFVSIGYRF